MDFALARKNYKGPINRLAYIGFMGDIAVFVALFAYWKYRKNQKEALAPILREKQNKENMYF